LTEKEKKTKRDEPRPRAVAAKHAGTAVVKQPYSRKVETRSHARIHVKTSTHQIRGHYTSRLVAIRTNKDPKPCAKSRHGQKDSEIGTSPARLTNGDTALSKKGKAASITANPSAREEDGGDEKFAPPKTGKGADKATNGIKPATSAAGKTRAATSAATAAASFNDEAAACKAIKKATNGLSTTIAAGKKRKAAAEADAENEGDDDEGAAPNKCATIVTNGIKESTTTSSTTATNNAATGEKRKLRMPDHRHLGVKLAQILARPGPEQMFAETRPLTSGGQAGPPILIFRWWWYVSLFADIDDDQSDRTLALTLPVFGCSLRPRNSQEGSTRKFPTLCFRSSPRHYW